MRSSSINNSEFEKKNIETNNSSSESSIISSESDIYEYKNEETKIISKSLSSNDIKSKKRKRERNKGRKAVFLMEKMIYDQQMLIAQHRWDYSYPNQFNISQIPYINNNQNENTLELSPPSIFCKKKLPILQTISNNNVPGEFDLIPRGK